jgi:hypothetical protein
MNRILFIGYYHFNYPIVMQQIKVILVLLNFPYSIFFSLEEEIYVIAMHLDLFVRHCFPKWSNVYTIASKIMTDLSTNDAEFYDHLKTISKIRTKINPKVKMKK